GGDIGPVGGCLDGLVLIDGEDLAVLADVKSDAVGHLPVRVEDAQGSGQLALGIAENGIVNLQRFGKLLVELGSVGAGCEVRDVVFANGLAVVPERLAL